MTVFSLPGSISSEVPAKSSSSSSSSSGRGLIIKHRAFSRVTFHVTFKTQTRDTKPWNHDPYVIYNIREWLIIPWEVLILPFFLQLNSFHSQASLCCGDRLLPLQAGKENTKWLCHHLSLMISTIIAKRPLLYYKCIKIKSRASRDYTWQTKPKHIISCRTTAACDLYNPQRIMGGNLFLGS